jgi:hypothetical protein
VASPPHASLKFSLILSISLGLSFVPSQSLSRLGRKEKKKKKKEERKGREKRKTKEEIKI